MKAPTHVITNVRDDGKVCGRERTDGGLGAFGWYKRKGERRGITMPLFAFMVL